MSRRDQIRMTDDEVRAFLEEARTLHMATIDRDGTPHLVAMWFTLLDGHPTVWTYARSQKVRNLERDPRVAVLVEAGERYEELRGVQIRGRARIERDARQVLAVGESLFLRYNDSPLDAAREALLRQSAKRVAVVVEPERVVSWDHRKLGGVY